MFVVMVEVRRSIDLRELYFDLEKRGQPVKARAPGSLGQSVVNIREWVIGSIEARVLNTSVFVFPNGKIKVSGGSVGYCASEPYDKWLETQRVLPVLRELLPEVPDPLVLKISLINGSHTLKGINMLNFLDICNELEKEPQFMVSKPSMFVNPGKRGRICSVSIKTHKVRGSMRFDHSGKLQLFGFKAHGDMKVALDMLEIYLKKIL